MNQLNISGGLIASWRSSWEKHLGSRSPAPRELSVVIDTWLEVYTSLAN